MMVAAIRASVHTHLDHGRAAEFAAPNHQRVVQHAALLQILQQPGAGLIGVAAIFRDVFHQVVMLVPSLMVELHEADTALHQPAREQAVIGERGLCPAQRRTARAFPSIPWRCSSDPERSTACETPSRRS